MKTSKMSSLNAQVDQGKNQGMILFFGGSVGEEHVPTTYICEIAKGGSFGWLTVFSICSGHLPLVSCRSFLDIRYLLKQIKLVTD